MSERPARDWELLCLRLLRQLPRDNPVRRDAETFLAAHGSGIVGVLREEYPASDFGELKGSPTDELPPPPGVGELKGSPLDELYADVCGVRRCPTCDGQMHHTRLKGYRCGHCS